MPQIALVTGGSRGIGEQYCRLLYQHGIQVIIVDINAEKGQALAQELEGSIFQEADISKSESWQKLAEEFPRVDYLFLNAGTYSQPNMTVQDQFNSKANDVTVAMSTVQRTMEVNFYQIVYGIGFYVPLMEKQGKGSIVVNASIVALMANPKEPVYAATKYAVLGYMRAIKEQLNEKNIKTYEICPGLVGTDMIGLGPEELPFQVLDPKVVAEAAVEAALQDKPSQTITILLGREPIVQEQKEFVKFSGELTPPKIQT
eukprot:TRINITY_DN22466_c0_g2_i1.p1 TRINITY_DN22466_c0_g2~~TRINITY_DN22466_c0_g2_i1.p1  ORF type:complete len:258 (-),score=43.76 TRINITY_DN22466_c0_g2_i1:420-1193(-)